MNSHLTELAFILDRSGSMQPLVEPAIAGFNQFLAEQQRTLGRARLTVVLFDDEYLLHADALPVSEVIPLDTTTYVPRGSTALLDAIGRTIDELGQRLAATPETDRPGKVIVAILTDGEENASASYTWAQISRRIRRQRQKYQWEFLFLGANQDAIATASQLSIAAANAATFAGDKVGMRTTGRSTSRRISALRMVSMGEATPEDQLNASKPMTEMVQEDDRELRGGSEAGK